MVQQKFYVQNTQYSCFSYNTTIVFLENTALWKNHIGSIEIKGLGVENSDSPSRM
jgi:hypothetical protein